jgi:hypothetical protein
MALAGGASRIAVYKLIDTPGDRAANPEPFGLVRDDGSRRPAFAAFQVAANVFAGFTSATLDHRDARYAQVTVQRGEATTTVLWTRSAESVQVQVAARSAQAILVDAFGGRRTLTPRDGIYTIDLPGCTQPFCITGGAPRLLVEGAPAASIEPVAPAQPTIQLSTESTATPTLELTITPTDTPMPTGTPTFTPTPTQPAILPTSQPATTLSPPESSSMTQPGSGDAAIIFASGILLGSLFVAFILARASPHRDSS